MERIQLRAGRPLLPASARPWAWALAVGCAILGAVLGAVFAHQSAADGFDHAVDAPVITAFGGHAHLLQWMIAPGSPAVAAVLTVAMVVACLLTGRLNGALLAAAAVPVADGLCDGLLKPAFHRVFLGILSYPSGHTTAVVALAATVTVLVAFPPQPVRARALRVLLVVVAWAAVVPVVLGLIALQFHYFTDTVGGAAAGIGIVCLLALMLDLPVVRQLLARVTRQPAEPQASTEPDEVKSRA